MITLIADEWNQLFWETTVVSLLPSLVTLGRG